MSKYAPHRSFGTPRATSSTTCQKCLKTGHYTYECKAPARPYVSRPSRTQQLENPRVLAKLRAEGKPSVEVPEEFKSKSGTANRILSAKEKERQEAEAQAAASSSKSKKRAKSSSSSSSSSSDSSSSDSDSDSDSGSDSDSSGSSSSSGSSHRAKRRRRRTRSPSVGSDSDSKGRSSRR